MSRFALAALFVAALFTAQGAYAQSDGVSRPVSVRANVLRVIVTGVNSTRGHVRVDVCTRSEFLKEDCRYSGATTATRGVTVVEVRDIPPGIYAIQAYDDRNDNTDVDRDLIGIPVEAVGFSNDAPVRFSPPSFKDAAFSYAGGDQTITLRLRRFLP